MRWTLAFFVATAASGPGGCKRDHGEAKPAKIGEVLTFEDSDWTVLEVKDGGKKMQSNNAYSEAKTTEGRFLQIRYRVMNKGKKDEHVLDTPKIVDVTGREFGPIPLEAFFVPPGTKSLGLDAIHPRTDREFWTVIEVPSDAIGLRFQTHGLGLFGKKKLVDLGR